RIISKEDEYSKYYNFNYIKNLRGRPYNTIPFANNLYTPQFIALINIQPPPPLYSTNSIPSGNIARSEIALLLARPQPIV
ncbi:hypothetical protein NEUTE2DRAFT_74765, partial [Neurospora tetrasperma FGSC 2509]